ncbi:hypothetical protein H4S02_012538, partial [Coemansia sp. RSA 2611]
SGWYRFDSLGPGLVRKAGGPRPSVSAQSRRPGPNPDGIARSRFGGWRPGPDL